jgi:hypothetical protein
MESTISGKLLGLLNDSSRFGKNPMDMVADDIIIGWCDLDSKTRYRVAAAVVRLFKRPNDCSTPIPQAHPTMPWATPPFPPR